MLLGPGSWTKLISLPGTGDDIDKFVNTIRKETPSLAVPDYLPELMELEYTRYRVLQNNTEITRDSLSCQLNPTLEILHLNWPLAKLYNKRIIPEKPEEEWILIWKQPGSGNVSVKAASVG
jgi:hypothetical protein